MLFLDEAGTPGGAEFVLGGVAVDPARWDHLRQGWADLAGWGGRDPRAEVKWSRTRGPDDAAGRLIDLLVEVGATAFVVLLHPLEGTRIAPELFRNGADTYATALMFIAERFQHFLAQENSYGAVVLDQRNGEQDDRLRHFFARLAKNGTPFTSLERIIDPILFSPSHETLGIQAADIVVGPVYAMHRTDRQAGPNNRLALARDLHERLRPCFARHPRTGEIEGVGIKQFPIGSERYDGKLFNLRTVNF